MSLDETIDNQDNCRQIQHPFKSMKHGQKVNDTQGQKYVEGKENSGLHMIQVKHGSKLQRKGSVIQTIIRKATSLSQNKGNDESINSSEEDIPQNEGR